MKLAVVILNWNGAQMLRQFLPGVVAYSPEATVFVADNASSDESLKVLKAEFPEVRRIILDQNYGFAEGYNRALKDVDADYFLLLNSDVEVTKDWLNPLLAYMENHPEVGACQPKLLSYKNKRLFEYAGASGGYIDCFGYPYCRGRIFEVVEEDEGQYDEVVPVTWATGAALMVRAEDYWEAGGLDDRFFAHMEEIDLCWRLRSMGRGLVCVPQSVVYHVGGATLQKSNPRKTMLNFRNNLYMLYKNLPDEDLNRVMRWRLLLDMVACLKFVLTMDLGNAKAVIQARREFAQNRSLFRPQREENLRRTVTPLSEILSPFSLLWRFYGCGEKKFSNLKKFVFC